MGEGGYRQINKTLNVCAFDNYLVTQHSRLPKLLDVEQLSSRVIRVLGQNAGKVCLARSIFTLQGTNTYIIGTGTQRLIIDTAQGYRQWADLIATTLKERNIVLSHVLLTHWHGDHTGGVPDLIRMYPELKEGIYKNAPEQEQKPIENNQVFSVEGATIRAVHAPGHSHDHMCFVLEEEQAIFTGDNVLGHGTSAVEQLGLYMETLVNLRSQGCTLGYPAHGAVIRDLPGKITAELEQKKRREKQCLTALRHLRNGRSAAQGSVTVGELVVAMHGTQLDVEVRRMALEPFMEEVLRKLAEDDKVGYQMRKGVRKWFALQD
ncbi:metallo-beta-lactamase superfamily protein [Phaeosphaeriaceae sp. PMI808]|nr:metallo-beta-lactamase superfamily protein [Phaeosphaeriaceae sp. PMI808]